MSDNRTSDRDSRAASNGVRWAIAVAFAIALVLPIELDRHHHAAQTPNARLMGAIFFGAVVAAIARAVIAALAPIGRGRMAASRLATARSRRWTLKYAAGALASFWVVKIGLGGILHAVGATVPHGIGTLILEITFLATLIPLYRSRRLRPLDLGFRAAPAALSVGLVFLAAFAYGLFSGLWEAAVHAPPVHSNFAGIRHEPTTVIALTGFAAAVGAPVAEEIFFRGFLYRALRNRISIAPACVLSSVIFGLGHTQYPLLVRPVLVVFGIIACLLYERTGSLLPGMALHSLIDASGFETALTGRSWIVSVIFLALAAALLARPSLRMLRHRFSGGRLAPG